MTLNLSSQVMFKNGIECGLYNRYSILMVNPAFSPGPFETCCSDFHKANGYGNNIGAYVNFGLNPNFFIGFDFEYGSYNSELYVDKSELINIGGNAYDGIFRQQMDLHNSFYFIGASVNYRLLLELYLKFKGGLSITGINSYKYFEKIISPEDRGVFFDSKSRIRNQHKGSLNLINYLPFLSGSFYYRLPLTSSLNFSIIPEISYKTLIGDISGDGLNFSNLGLSLGISYFWKNEQESHSITLEEKEIKDIEASIWAEIPENNSTKEIEFDVLELNTSIKLPSDKNENNYYKIDKNINYSSDKTIVFHPLVISKNIIKEIIIEIKYDGEVDSIVIPGTVSEYKWKFNPGDFILYDSLSYRLIVVDEKNNRDHSPESYLQIKRNNLNLDVRDKYLLSVKDNDKINKIINKSSDKILIINFSNEIFSLNRLDNDKIKIINIDRSDQHLDDYILLLLLK